jgi:hypothetical protein
LGVDGRSRTRQFMRGICSSKIKFNKGKRLSTGNICLKLPELFFTTWQPFVASRRLKLFVIFSAKGAETLKRSRDIHV